MSRLRIILVTGLLLIVTMASSQRYFVTNQYVYDMFLMNPAAAGFNRTCVSVNGFYQRQWFGTDLAPTTQLFAAQMPAGGNVGSGTYILNDRNGHNRKMSLMQAFSVEIKIKENRNGTNTSLVFGLGALIEQATVDQSNFEGGVGIDPVVSGNKESGIGYNANTGMLLRIGKYHVGAAATNILPQNNPLYDSEYEPELPVDFHVHAGTYFKYPTRDIWFEPQIYYRRNSLQDTRLDLNMKLDIPTFNQDFSFWGVIAYRRNVDSKFGKSLGLAVTGGINYKGINVGLEHQLGLTGAQTHYGSAYLLVFGYNFCHDKKTRSLPCSERDPIVNPDAKYRKKGGLFKR